MAASTTIDKFRGMNNVDRVSPIRVIHNMNVTPDKKLEKREGYALWQALSGAHSLFFDGYDFLCAATGSATPQSLYRVSRNKEITEICPINGMDNQLYYIPLLGKVYISSSMWNGIYEDGQVRQWGRSFGDDPAMLENSSTSEELMLLTTIAAPFMENLCLAGGRIYGSVGNRIYYNDPPMGYELFRPDAFYDFPDEVIMIAAEGKGGIYAKDGLYIATATTTWFAAGYDPETWELAVVGDGAIPGTLQYVPSLKDYGNVPVWLNRQGVQAGISGVLQPLSKDKVRFDAAGKAASFYREQGGGQYLSNFIQPPDVGFGDFTTCEVVRAGKLIT